MTKEIGSNLMENDYFADRLLEKLDVTDPVLAAFEAQDVSRDVGFDFADFQDVVPRALDEIRETKEALSEEGDEGREHFGDEIADIMFSLVNLARHAGKRDLPTMSELAAQVTLDEDNLDSINLIDTIGIKIKETAEKEKTYTLEKFSGTVDDLFSVGMHDAITLAVAHSFDPEQLLKENVRKYLARCQAIEKLAAEDGKQWHDLAEAGEIIDYWKRAKTLLK